jgi:hypothetical protein
MEYGGYRYRINGEKRGVGDTHRARDIRKGEGEYVMVREEYKKMSVK